MLLDAQLASCLPTFVAWCGHKQRDGKTQSLTKKRGRSGPEVLTWISNLEKCDLLTCRLCFLTYLVGLLLLCPDKSCGEPMKCEGASSTNASALTLCLPNKICPPLIHTLSRDLAIQL